jgi:predicted small secreted protein
MTKNNDSAERASISKPTLFKVLVLSALGATSLALSACNTVSGVGRDIQEMSDNTKNAIEN